MGKTCDVPKQMALSLTNYNITIIEQRKQLDDLVLDETNIKDLVRVIGETDEGQLRLNYNRETRQYTFVLPSRTLKAKDETVLKILSGSKE